MSTLTTTTMRGVVPAPTTTTPRLTFGRVLRSEWIKLWTLKSTTYTLVGVLVALIGFGLVAALSATDATTGPTMGENFGGGDPVVTVLTGAHLAILVVSVLGVLVGAREFSSGMIRSTIAAVPSRLPVLWGKVIAFIAATTPVVVVGVTVAFFGGTAILGNAGAATASWSDPGVAGAVLGTAAYLVGLGVIGVFLGVILRSIAGGIATLIGGLLFLPSLASALLPSSWDSMLKYLPSNAGGSFTSVTPIDGMLSAGSGALVFAMWIAVALAGAAITLKRRDV